MNYRLLAFALLAAARALGIAQNEVPDTLGASYDLDDLVVTADKPLVQSDGAKMTYNLAEDPATKGNSLTEALRKVPLVSVDGEGNIQINGQQSFKVFVNGREDPALTANYKDIFKAMPANAVQKIEVITEPGAKYDSEGLGGILNLVTETRQATDGYSASLTGSFGKQNTGASAYLRVKSNRLTVSLDADYANGNLFKQKTDQDMMMENLNAPALPYTLTHNRQVIGYDFARGAVRASLDAGKRDLVTANFQINYLKGKLYHGSLFSTTMLNADKSVSSTFSRRLNAIIDNSSMQAGAAWQHDFTDDRTSNLVLSYLYTHGKNGTDAAFTMDESTGTPNVSPYQHNINDLYLNEHTVQADYTKTFGNHLVETGAKAIFRRNDAFSNLYEGHDAASAREVIADRSDMAQFQDIYAAYASYTAKAGKLSGTAGLRYEHTRMGVEFRWGDTPDFTNRLNDVVPNAALSWNFTMARSLRLAYQMRISRPSLSQVNPYRFSYLPGFTQAGNPDLSSERLNKLTLTYSSFGRSFGGNVAVEYSRTGNAISEYITADASTILTTYANIGKEQHLSLNGFMTWTINRKFNMNLSARLSQKWLETRSPDYSNKGLSLNYTANVTYTPVKVMKFNAYAGQTTRNYSLQGHDNGWYYYGIGATRDFLADESLSVTLSANNFLQKGTTYKSWMQTETVKTENKFKNDNWHIGLSVTWRFGQLKEDVRRTGKSIVNDDVSSQSGSGGLGM